MDGGIEISEPDVRSPMWRRGLAAVILLFFGLSISALLLEGVLRLGLIENPRCYRYANSGKVDGNDARRLLIIGDSFMRPQGMLNRSLSDDLADRRILTMNIAKGGDGPVEYRRAMARTVPDFRPNMILVTYYVGNDLTDVQKRPPGTSTKPDDHGVLRSLAEMSYLYSYLDIMKRVLYGEWVAYRNLELAGVPPDVIKRARALEMNPHLVLTGRKRPGFVLFNTLMEDESSRRVWERMTNLFLDMKGIAEENDARLAVVIFPHSVQVDTSHFPFLRDLGFELDERTLTEDRPQRLLTSLCDDLGVPCLDLLPVFRAHTGAALYLENDTHLNDEGDLVASAAIREFLLRDTILGEPPRVSGP